MTFYPETTITIPDSLNNGLHVRASVRGVIDHRYCRWWVALLPTVLICPRTLGLGRRTSRNPGTQWSWERSKAILHTCTWTPYQPNCMPSHKNLYRVTTEINISILKLAPRCLKWRLHQLMSFKRFIYDPLCIYYIPFLVYHTFGIIGSHFIQVNYSSCTLNNLEILRFFLV